MTGSYTLAGGEVRVSVVERVGLVVVHSLDSCMFSLADEPKVHTDDGRQVAEDQTKSDH
mgnify:FL=1